VHSQPGRSTITSTACPRSVPGGPLAGELRASREKSLSSRFPFDRSMSARRRLTRPPSVQDYHGSSAPELRSEARRPFMHRNEFGSALSMTGIGMPEAVPHQEPKAANSSEGRWRSALEAAGAGAWEL